MTTTETLELNLLDACIEAGVGGLVQRDGDPYTVGLDEEENFTLTRDREPRTPCTTFVQDRWTVVRVGLEELEDEEPEAVETVTVLEFFYNLSVWTFVTPSDSDTQYLFAGIDWDENGRQVARLIHERYISETTLHEDTLALENAWVPVKNGDGTNREADVMVRNLVHQLRTEQGDVTHWLNRYEETAEKLSKATVDFATVNRKINEYADNDNMCSDYERKLFSWNTELSMFRLEGRASRNFTFHVPIRIPVLGNQLMYVSINGEAHGVHSPEQAREYAKEMSHTDILRSLYDTGFVFEVVHDDDEPITY